MTSDSADVLDDLSGPMGIRVLRSTYKDAATLAITPSAPLLVAPMNATILEGSVAGGPSRLVDRSSFLLVPRGTPWVARPMNAVVHVVCLHVNEPVRALTVSDYKDHIARDVLERVFSTPRLLTRSRWLDELLFRYRFERLTCQKRDNAATRFLEVEITKELFFSCLGADDADVQKRSVLHGGSRLVDRAVAHIEERLFDTLDARDIARSVGASESTLLRRFKSELGHGPSQYIRARRLDESLLLVRTGGFSISEIATKVGYRNVAAFTSAFHKRFGRAPSAVRDKEPTTPGKTPGRRRKRAE